MKSNQTDGAYCNFKREVLDDIERDICDELNLLKPISRSWQPSDYLPDFSTDSWQEEIIRLRDQSAGLSPELLTVLIGDMVTEEALPSYQTWLSNFDEINDSEGASDRPWALWSRGWTAEENRHGDLLNKWLYLSGRVNLKNIEKSIHGLLKAGFDPKTSNDPYKAFIYTSFQERATKISHSNVGKLAVSQGDDLLQKICLAIATDEARHEEAYKRFSRKVLQRDPNGFLIAAREMFHSQITMPAALMKSDCGENLFQTFSEVAQHLGVYTTTDYAGILKHLVAYWQIDELAGLSASGRQAQEYICRLPERYEKLAWRLDQKNKEKITVAPLLKCQEWFNSAPR